MMAEGQRLWRSLRWRAHCRHCLYEQKEKAWMGMEFRNNRVGKRLWVANKGGGFRKVMKVVPVLSP